MKIPGIVIAASASGSGKTAVTMAMKEGTRLQMRTGLY